MTIIKILVDLHRERLRTAQSLRDKGVRIDISYIAKTGYSELNQMKGY